MKTTVLETVIPHHHEMISFIVKHIFTKGPSKTTCYQNFKNFAHKTFNSYLESKVSECPNSIEKYLQIFQDIVQLFCLSKKIIIRYNNNMFMTKNLRKAVMIRSKL